MEKREFKVGDKVKIPKTKSIGLKINNPLIENLIKKEKQDYLIVEYVSNLITLEQRVSCMFPTSKSRVNFLNTDLEHYEEFPEKWAIKLYPEVKKWIEEEYQTDYYSKDSENNIFHFPNWDNNNGFLLYNHTDSEVIKEYTLITLEQFKKHFLKEEQMERKIVGYKLIKPEYEGALKNIQPYWCKGLYEKEGYNVVINSGAYHEFKKAGVLDLWFEPVYKEEFKVGDWVTIIKGASDDSKRLAGRTLKIKKIETIYNYIKVEEGASGLHYNSGRRESPNEFRKATPEEIKASQTTIIKMHSSNKGEFEIEVVDGKAYYRPENKELPKEWIKDIIDIFGEQGGINYPYRLEVKSVNVGCMHDCRKEDFQKVYDLLQ